METVVSGIKCLHASILRAFPKENILLLLQSRKAKAMPNYCIQLQDLCVLSGLCAFLGETPLIVLYDFCFVL